MVKYNMGRRHRKTRREKRKQKKLIIVSMIGLLCVMSAGYAAFQTNITITAKGTISKKELTPEKLKEQVVTSGDGLYLDTTEEGRYVYRGANPHNYIYIKEKNGTQKQNVLYRIISVESDGTLKIIRNASLGVRPFEENSARSAAYCNFNLYGCNVWGSKTTMLNSMLENVTTMPTYVGGSALALPTAESQMNTYLNTTYYNTLTDDSKAVIDNHIWNVGPLDQANKTLEQSLIEESSYKWRGKVGLIYPTDYVKASINSSCTNIYNGTSKNSSYPCKNNNYLQAAYSYWTMSPSSSSGSHLVWYVYGTGYLNFYYAEYGYGVRPTLFLTSDINLEGEGTSTTPYTIVSE